MATIVDPDDLRLSSNPGSSSPNGEVYINPTTNPPTIELISKTEWSTSGSSNFSATDGVSLQALYSFLKEQWKNNDTDQFYRYKFPMEAITAEQFEFIENWEPANAATRTYIRTGGWEEKKASGSSKQAYMGVITLGTISETNPAQTAYHAWYDTGTAAYLTGATDFNFPGPVNEAVKIFGDVDNGNFNYREKQLFVFIRPDTVGTTGYTYDQSSTNAIGSGAGVTNQVYRFPLQTAVDLNITITSASALSLSASKAFEIRFDQTSLSSNQLPIQLNGGTYNFTHVIQSSTNQTLVPADIYNWVQYSLRKNVDINADTGTADRIGKLTPALVQFVGPKLQTFAIEGGTEGVLIDDFDTGQTGNLAFRDNTNTLREFPVIASGKITFSGTLVEDPSTRYWMFYTSASSGAWPGASAVIVDDYNGNDVANYLHSSSAVAAQGAANGTTGVTTSGSSAFTVASAGWTVNDYQGKVLEVTSASSAGYYFISSNTADTITIDGTFENSATAQSFQIFNKSNGEVSWNFDYTGGTSRNDGKSGDAPITIVALGLNNAQYITATGSIGSGTGQNFPVTAPLERNYNDPI